MTEAEFHREWEKIWAAFHWLWTRAIKPEDIDRRAWKDRWQELEGLLLNAKRREAAGRIVEAKE